MKQLNTIILFILSSINIFAQDTFSIVAVDSITGEIGSAGASCLGYFGLAPKGAYIISDIIPGKGAIHTQAYWDGDNQAAVRAHMLAGESPQQIIDWIKANDQQGDSSIRQYGVVDLNNGHPRAAGFTGSGCEDYKSHITGRNYAIQGNILKGRQILDSMESRFLAGSGPMSERLMAALQGAKVVGADTRCGPKNSSSLSSFLRVARASDSNYINLYMSYDQNFSGLVPVDPIDSLQTLFTAWKAANGIAQAVPERIHIHVSYPEGRSPFIFIQSNGSPDHLTYTIIDMQGRIVASGRPEAWSFSPVSSETSKGIYLLQIGKGNRIAGIQKIVVF